MQKILANILFSTRLTAILFIVFAVTMITGTFLDMHQETSPTAYTRTLIYNAWWFEAIMGIFVVNFIGNIWRYRLYKKEKWATLVLHLAFILILLGAFVTRYIGYEGSMGIREGESSNTFMSRENYITVYIDGDYVVNGENQRKILEYPVDFSARLDNHFNETTDYNGQAVSIELEKFIKGAEEDIIPNESGAYYLKMVESGGGAPHNHFLKVGEKALVHNLVFTLNNPAEGAVNITYQGDSLAIESPFEGEYLTMATMNSGQVIKDSIQPLHLRSRYIIGGLQVVFPKPVVKGTFELVKKPQILKGDEEGITFNISSNGETKQVNVLGGQYINNNFKIVEVGGLQIALRYGSKIRELPFSIKLNDFIAERYPGTEKSYSSYESKVTVIDPQKEDFDFHIYMNHILNHGGYRFFQSSFHPDEKGTILSVNHDSIGTWLTYIGYFLLFAGMLAIIFLPNTRFSDLRKQLKKISEKKKAMLSIWILAFSITGFSQNHQHTGPAFSDLKKAQVDSILKANVAPVSHTDKFGHLVIQDFSGRMMPVNTYASEMLRKLSKKDSYEGLDANQIFLSMQESPLLWYKIPIIYLTAKKSDTVRNIIGISKDDKFATLVDFFSENGQYKLAPYLEDAYKAGVPNAYQSEIIKADQKVNLLYSTIEGRTLKIFPVPNDANNTWISTLEYREGNYQNKIQDSLYRNYIVNGFAAYLTVLNNAKQSGDYSKAEDLYNSFYKVQHKYGSEVMPSDKKISAEVLYNKYDVFRKLFAWYVLTSIILLTVVILQIFNQSKPLNIASKVLKGIIIFLFALHTLGLIARWYVSGHAPWSDAYESMIYVAWATMFFGLLLSKKSTLTLASTAFVTSMLLMVAHLSWMDPAIANLQPVLNSYWLMIHVAIIVASYGPFTLGMVLGLVALFLMAFTNPNNRSKLDLHIKELTAINEMALTVGLVMLTIGNFLGGMWANESWGRYWGWDPKETWALISIMAYAFVIHMRLVPGLRGRFAFNLSSVIAIAFIIFTYFGVNFYLSGLHSYQSGQQIDSLKSISLTVGLVSLLAILAYRKYVKYYKK